MFWVLASTGVWVIGTWGDLVESSIKRAMGVKDSGNILPGHGGMLDRFDSFIYILPFILFLLQFFSK
jgi:phosphatidate cytidylyltransferase